MESKWLPEAHLTASGRPIFLSGEIERAIIPKVDLEAEDNPSLAPLRSGNLCLTTHRLIWIKDSSNSGFFLPLEVLIEVNLLKKTLKTMFHSPRINIQVKSPTVKSEKIIIIFRDKQESPDLFYSRVLEVWRSRSWEVDQRQGRVGSSRDDSAGDRRSSTSVVGVSGILRKEQEKWESTERNLQEAFQDLSSLMAKAKQMVQLAEQMGAMMFAGSNSQTSGANDDELGSKQELQEWILSVGIVSPVTRETAGALYHRELSRQLADFVQEPLKKSGGMIALVDVYYLFNRARGTELISPEDLLQACKLWEKLDVSVMVRKFESGVMVVQDKIHSDKEVFERIQSMASKPEALRQGVGPTDAARTLGIAPALAKEYLMAAENQGILCRDVSPEGLRFYVNLFRAIDPSRMHSESREGLFKAWASATTRAH